MKNIVKILISTVVVTLLFTACHKEGDLPVYTTGNGTVLTGSTTTVAAPVADSAKVAFTLNWTWPNYATDSANQKFVIQIDSAGKNFASPFTKVVKGKLGYSFTAKELNSIVFGFGDISAAYALEMRVISSYANNNELYLSNNVVNVTVTPYIIPITLTLDPVGPLTLVVADALNKAVTFNWNATQYSNMPLNYAIQIDKADGLFTAPTVILFNAATTGSITVNDLNNAAINAGVAPTTTGDITIRVIAYQGINFANPLYSNVATLKVTTYLSILTWYVPGNYVTASYPGTSLLNWDPANSPQVKSLSSAPTKLEGYVYMAGAANEWKFASKPNWDGPNYGAGAAAGTLDAAGGNFNSPAGYYKLNADASALTYTAVATVWGVIGAATPEGWDNETALTFDPATSTWRGGMACTVGEFKFRANHDWGFNYGSTAGNATLDAGGSNIPLALAADYYFVLDLSHPNAYTYSANRWGLIGSAIPGTGWDSDQNMTWDAATKAMKITLDLVAGEVKFRANDDWGFNYGGDIAALTPGGANIAIATAGNYTISLFLDGTVHCTIVKN